MIDERVEFFDPTGWDSPLNKSDHAILVWQAEFKLPESFSESRLHYKPMESHVVTISGVLCGTFRLVGKVRRRVGA
ncbi:hypothetical protein [Streptomyces sp. NPDC088785]|uniref:hypothetical protein n=1 Tax=Streptomyces sp. NPDC088785 TaxID=3365897 RepID=UPI00382FFA3E